MNKKGGGVLKNAFVTVSARIVVEVVRALCRSDHSVAIQTSTLFFLAVGDVAVFSTGLLMNRYIPRIVCNRVIMIDIYRHMYAVGFPVYLVECVALQPPVSELSKRQVCCRSQPSIDP